VSRVHEVFTSLVVHILASRLKRGDSHADAVACAKAVDYTSFAFGYEAARIAIPAQAGLVSLEDAELMRRWQPGQTITITISSEGCVPVFVAETSH